MTTKTISEELAEIGVSHSKSEIAGLHNVYSDQGVLIDQMCAHDAALFYTVAQCAA